MVALLRLVVLAFYMQKEKDVMQKLSWSQNVYWVIAPLISFWGAQLAQGQILVNDGNFNTLGAGLAPDCDLGAGNWFWPAAYTEAALCEHYQAETQIVTKENTPGDLCLRLEGTNDPATDIYHLPHIFSRILNEGESGIITLTFEMLIASEDLAGGGVYLSGDHGGSGYHYAFDRGPQLYFDAGGVQGYQWALPEGEHLPLVFVEVPARYVPDQWEFVRVDVDLVSDTFELWLAPDGQTLQLVGHDLPFRSGPLDHIDRVTVANFGQLSAPSEWFVDNFRVVDNTDCNENSAPDIGESQLYAGDFNGDLQVDLSDHQRLLECLTNPGSVPFPRFGKCAQLCQQVFDSDLDGDVDLFDIAEFQNEIQH